MPVVLLSTREVCRRVCLTRRWVYELERTGRFPQRVQVSCNRVAWLESEVDAWIAEKAAARKPPRVRP